MKKSQYIPVAVVLVAIALIAIFGGAFSKQSDVTVTESATSTEMLATTSTQSVTLPNGTVIPNVPKGAVVEVVESRQVTPTISVENVTLKLGETRKVGKLTLTIKSIKDTRCTGSTQCVGVGDARVLLGVSGPITTKNVSLIEQQAFYIDDIKVSLTNVLPDRKYNQTIADADYQFFITIESVE